MKSLFKVLIAITLLVSCAAQTSQNDQVRQVNKQEWTTLVAADEAPQIIDVRTPEEYAAGNIPGSTNIDFRADNFEKMIADLDSKRPVYVYCKSGGRSAKACNMLNAIGHTDIVELKGGFDDWK